MADDKEDLDEAEAEELELTSEGEKTGGKKKLIIIIAIAVVLLLGGGVGAFMMMGSGGSSEDGAEGEEVAEQVPPPEYYSMVKPFVVRFDTLELFSLMRIKLSIMARYSDVLNVIKDHESLMRHQYVDILSQSRASSLLTRKGKISLRRKLIKVARKIVEDNGDLESLGDHNVEQVFITEFVMQ